MSEWMEYKLGDVAEITSSKRIFYSEYVENGVPFYRSKEIIDLFNRRDIQTELYITEKRFKEIEEKFGVPNADDILLTSVGSLGIPYKVKPKDRFYFKDGNLTWFRNLDKNKIKPDFLFTWLSSNVGRQKLDEVSIGSTQAALTISGLKTIEILLPDLKTQTAIASVLSSLDDKIDLLHRQNTTLEKMAETLFRQWFVEFSENKGEKTYNSELGEIPISIRIDQIKNLSHILESGKRPKGGVGSLTTGVPSIGAESIKGLGNFDYTKTKFVSEQFAGSMSKGFVNGYELLIYKDGGTPGHFIPRYSIFGAGFPFDKMVINEHVFKLDFGSKAYNFFMYYFFQTEITESILVANGAKAAIPGINQEDIRSLWVITPDNSLIESFGEITLPYLEKVLSNCKQIRTLTALRDTLLPKLMSGEVRVELN